MKIKKLNIVLFVWEKGNESQRKGFFYNYDCFSGKYLGE